MHLVQRRVVVIGALVAGSRGGAALLRESVLALGCHLVSLIAVRQVTHRRHFVHVLLPPFSLHPY